MKTKNAINPHAERPLGHYMGRTYQRLASGQIIRLDEEGQPYWRPGKSITRRCRRASGMFQRKQQAEL